MRKLTLLAAAAALAFAAPAFVGTAFAQTVPAPAAQPAPAPEDAESPEEAAFEARAEAFGERMKSMSEEMQAAITAAGTDEAKKKTDLDAIQARYQPDADAFATDLQAFIQTAVAEVPEEQRAAATARVQGAVPQIRGLPAMMRAQVEHPEPAPMPAQTPVPPAAQ